MSSRQEIIDYIENTEWDRECLPHYGLIPDWYLRYNELRDLICAYFRGLQESENVDEGALEDTHEGVVDPKS